MVQTEGVVYASTLGEPNATRLRYGPVVRSHDFSILRLTGHPDNILSEVAEAMRDHRISGAAIVAGSLPQDRLWWTYEWRNALIVDRALDARWLGEKADWRQDTAFDHPEVRIFLLRDEPEDGHRVEKARQQVETMGEFRESLGTWHPMAIEVAMSDGLARDRNLFGDLADARIGGAVALLMLSGATPSSTVVRLRNPAALDLDLIDDQRSISHQRRLGAITVRSIGVSTSWDRSMVETGFVEPEPLKRMWADRLPSWPYFVLLETEATVDPELFLPVGQVFEQSTVNATQTLALATSTSTVVTPGRLRPLVLPVWCLNNELAPPHGGAVTPTPLRTRYSTSTSQHEVWAHRTSVMAQ